ncbi:CMP-N-acetylneuraminic acid synthetase [Desulfatibacillum alkenivorans DSM 16219]|jgi:CMP-N-acetylneuraminic acid synthetase/spore coat polysaccharide biosynthesis predicted glycosyltransferase SpsG|uniref:CMP-N-acetylneuraminic acid synthetase n=1 Tax=Desulfatibacillum alkenivorans DSM 16219 TaxID=1121393 RepID=A0A1M6UGK0_9BACT|nr:glycosyltransferase [Desulfatibacillum alkenivorans]SHK68306.1 CMP-N-acetylneuraminic acid synthetase [Desulfatibacillum alkenivorans DSM 16219]
MIKKVLLVIPARGGSKGIPRKNLRPLCGKPLIAYSIKAALQSKLVTRIVISTEDEEIALFAKRFGANVLMRPSDLADDNVPLDPVIDHACIESEKKFKEKYDIIVTVQPTSPFITGVDIDQIIEKLLEKLPDTVLTAVEDCHLRWGDCSGKPTPLYSKRVNRQFLPMQYKETGAVIACTKEQLQTGSRIGENILLHIMDEQRSIDIDTYHDFWLCEMILKQKRIVFVVIGNHEIGMGHAYRGIMIANELIRHDIVFLCHEEDDLAQEIIRKNNYRMKTTSREQLLEAIFALDPDMVINDILNTSADYILALKKKGIAVINFEDMGLGAETADMVFNALYPHQIPKETILVGPKYFCLRDEFLHISKRQKRNNVKKVLLTFGGVDEGNLTCRVLLAIFPYLKAKELSVDIVLGVGYRHTNDLKNTLLTIPSESVSVIKNTSKISEFMNNADLAITSAGRTVLELASLQVPTIVIAQNFRETTHSMASSQNGFINLGFRKEISDAEILHAVKRVVEDFELRTVMCKKMESLDLKNGKKRVVANINSILGETIRDAAYEK